MELSHATGLGYGVEEAASSMMIERVLGALKKGTSKLVAKKAANGPPFFALRM